MYTVILSSALCLLTVVDLTNSHAVKPFAMRVAEPPVAVPTMDTWEVGTVSGSKHFIQAKDFAQSAKLYLFSDDHDEVVMAVPLDKLVYARKLRPNEKVPVP